MRFTQAVLTLELVDESRSAFARARLARLKARGEEPPEPTKPPPLPKRTRLNRTLAATLAASRKLYATLQKPVVGLEASIEFTKRGPHFKPIPDSSTSLPTGAKVLTFSTRMRDDEGRRLRAIVSWDELLAGLRRNGLDPRRNWSVTQLFPLFNLDPDEADAETSRIPGFWAEAAAGALAAIISLPFQPVYAVFQYLADKVLGLRVRALLVPSEEVSIRQAGIDKRTVELISRLQTG